MPATSPRPAVAALAATLAVALGTPPSALAQATPQRPFQPEVTARVVARSFLPTPTGDGFFVDFSDAQILPDGRVFFSATTSLGSAVYRWTPGFNGASTTDELLASGVDAPGAPGETLGVLTGFNRLVANSQGDAALRAFLDLDGPAGIDDDGGLWATSIGPALNTDTRLALREGDALPGAADASIFTIEDQLLSDAGRTAARVRLTGDAVDATNDFAILRETMPGVVETVAREGEPCPAVPGASYTVLGNPALAEPCDVVFDARLAGADVDASNDRALIVESSAGPRLVARSGDSAPGAPGAAFATFAQPTINSAGAVAALCTLAGPGVNGSNDRALLTEADGALRLLLREGDPAPGLPGLTVASIDNFDVALDGAGRTPVLGRVSGPGVEPETDAVLWFGGPDDLRVVAREGFYPPQFQGVRMGPFGVAQSVGPNADVFFVGTLTGDGVSSDNNEAVWCRTSGDELVIVLREGDAIDLAPAPGATDARTVDAFTPFGINTGGEEGRATFAGVRECVLALRFTDGTSAVVVFSVGFQGSTPTGCLSDFDRDGDVDLNDFNIFGSEFGRGLPGGGTPCDETP